MLYKSPSDNARENNVELRVLALDAVENLLHDSVLGAHVLQLLHRHVVAPYLRLELVYNTYYHQGTY